MRPDCCGDCGDSVVGDPVGSSKRNAQGDQQAGSDVGGIYPRTLHTAVYFLKTGRNFYEKKTRPGTFRPYLESSPGRKDLGGNR